VTRDVHIDFVVRVGWVVTVTRCASTEHSTTTLVSARATPATLVWAVTLSATTTARAQTAHACATPPGGAKSASNEAAQEHVSRTSDALFFKAL